MTIRPAPLAFSAGAAALISRMGPVRFTAMIFSQSSTVRLSKSWKGTDLLKAASLIRISSRPKRAVTAATRFSTAAPSVMSQPKAAALIWYWLARSRATPSAWSLLCAYMTAICTPSRAKAWQMRCPSPPFPPVTSATLPLSSMFAFPLDWKTLRPARMLGKVSLVLAGSGVALPPRRSARRRLAVTLSLRFCFACGDRAFSPAARRNPRLQAPR